MLRNMARPNPSTVEAPSPSGLQPVAVAIINGEKTVKRNNNNYKSACIRTRACSMPSVGLVCKGHPLLNLRCQWSLELLQVGLLQRTQAAQRKHLLYALLAELHWAGEVAQALHLQHTAPRLKHIDNVHQIAK